MPRRPVPLGLAAPVALLLLVLALGALQYRWVGQVSEAERDQMRQSLDRRAREFADDFDREVSAVWRAFRQFSADAQGRDDRFARALDEWQASSRFPGLVGAAYVAPGDGTIARFDRDIRAFAPAVWPDRLARVRERLRGEVATPPVPMPRGTRVVAFSLSPVMPDIPAIVIGEPAGDLPLGQGVQMRVRDNAPLATDPRHALILELDAAYIAATVLPTLADQHFPEAGADRYRVSVLDSSGAPILARGLAPAEAVDPDQADASSRFFGGITEVLRGVVTAAPAAAVPGATWTGGTGGRVSMVLEQHTSSVSATALRTALPGAWTLRLQHQAGSLAAAVERARRRNLLLSFGILGVLVASVGLVMVNARRAERLAAQQMDFVATVSHELRTPVAVIRSAAQNLSAGIVQDPAQARRYGEAIEIEGRRLTDMVEQVLEYAGLGGRNRPPAGRPVDAGALAREVVGASAATGASHLEFEVHVDSGAPPALADPEALRRALQNLVGNAIKHGGDGGWVGVRVTRGTGADQGRVVLSVSDRGPGIAAEDLAHIFEPFFRGRRAVDRQIQGNGLGLSLVKRIAEAHGGRVTVTSAPGHGATFSVSLPAASGAAVAADATAVSLERAAPSAGQGSSG